MKHLCILLVKFYRKYLSPLKGRPCCRFVPTCSAYSIEAFEKRGFFVGLILTIWRILRCNPLSVGGYDPVPEKGLRYKGSREIPVDLQDECNCHHTDDLCRRDDGGDGEYDACCDEIASHEEEGNQCPDETSIHRKDKNQ